MIELGHVAEIIGKVGPGRVILSSDAGSLVLPPFEALREFLMMLRSVGIAERTSAHACSV